MRAGTSAVRGVRGRCCGLPGLAFAFVLLLAPGSAPAATVSVVRDDFLSVAQVSDRNAERNELVVKLIDRARLLIVRDNAGGLHAKDGCEPTGEAGRRVRCDLAVRSGRGRFPFRFLFLYIGAGGGDDRITTAGRGKYRKLVPHLFISGGRGDDRVVGGRMDESVLAGRGDDRVDGSLGSDELVASPRADGDDRFDGGGGFNFLNFVQRTEPVAVDLRAETGGGASESDDFDDVRGVFGGSGGDTLSGGGAANALLGYHGADTIVARAGPDFVDGERGVDEFLAGTGSDSVIAVDGRVETVDCGPRRDFYIADSDDVLVSCEREIEFENTPASHAAHLPPARFDRAVARSGVLPAAWARALRARHLP